MPSNFAKKLYPALLLAWFCGFAAILWQAGAKAKTLMKSQEKIEDLRLQQEVLSQEVSTLTKDIRARSREMESLLAIVNLLPQEKGFIRTQQVISDEVQGLRKKVSRWVGKDKLHVVVDTKANKLYLKQGLSLLMAADCSVGRGGILKDKKTGRTWEFVTPLGEFRVWNKIENPIWTKPDWAFVETDEVIPPPGDPSRRVEGELGAYLLSLGDGYLIHGTKNEAMLGRAASHGCVRLGSKDLEELYKTAPVGTKVYIY